MTGQVKEEILTRFGELGVSVADGKIVFRPTLLREAEFFNQPTVWQELQLPADSLAFTLAATPIVYTRGARASICVKTNNGVRHLEGDTLDAAGSRAILQRSGDVQAVFVTIAADRWLAPAAVKRANIDIA